MVDKIPTEENGWVQELELVHVVVAEKTDARVDEPCQVEVDT